MNQLLNNPLTVFLATAIISFLGSVQPGVANVMASRFVLSHGKKYAHNYSLATCIPEFMYALLVAFYISKIDISNTYKIYITICTGLILVGFGLFIFFNPPKIEINQKTGNPFVLGFLASITNPQLIIFWSGWAFVYKKMGVSIHLNHYYIFGFAIGAAAGAYVLMLTYMKLSETYLKDLNEKKLSILNKISALILIFLGIGALISLLFT